MNRETKNSSSCGCSSVSASGNSFSSQCLATGLWWLPFDTVLYIYNYITTSIHREALV